jgi:hypothetical protein
VRDRRPNDRLRDANPVSIEEVGPPTSPEGRALYSRIVHSPAETPRRSWHRRYVMILVPVAIAAAVGAGLKWLRPASQPLVVVCYAGPSLGADRVVVSASSRGDVQACTELWQRGGRFAARSTAGVPSFAACVLHSGTVGVFPSSPGQDVCSKLGLAHLAPRGGTDEKQEIVLVQNAVVPRFLARCTGRADAVALVRNELDRHGLSDWRVVVVPFSPSAPCAGFAADVPHRTVDISPVSNFSTP